MGIACNSHQNSHNLCLKPSFNPHATAIFWCFFSSRPFFNHPHFSPTLQGFVASPEAAHNSLHRLRRRHRRSSDVGAANSARRSGHRPERSLNCRRSCGVCGPWGPSDFWFPKKTTRNYGFALTRFFGFGKFTQKIAKHHHHQSKSKSYLALCSDPHELLGYGFDAVAQFRCAKV